MFILALLVAVAFGVFGLMQHLKGKRILAAPFKKTGELSKNPASPDPKGAISTEGNVLPPAQQLLSPCSKTPCIYYEVEIRRHWEKTEQTQQGLKTSSGSDTHSTLKDGALVQLDDGSGPISVDFKQGADFDKLQRKFNEKVKLGLFVQGELQFGQLRMQTPVHIGSDRTVAYEAIEKIVTPEGKLFVLGRIEGDKIVKPGWRSMLASSKGRDGLLASTATQKKVGFIGGGIGAVAAIPLAIFAPKASETKATDSMDKPGIEASAKAGSDDKVAAAPSGNPALCNDQEEVTGARTCKMTMTEDGTGVQWKIEEAGTYRFVLSPVSPKLKHMHLTVTDESLDKVVDQEADAAGMVNVSKAFKPGSYSVQVSDYQTPQEDFPADLALSIQGTPGKAVAAVEAPAAKAVVPAKAVSKKKGKK